MKIYDLIKNLLEENEELRNSDKRLIWKVWEELDLASSYSGYSEVKDAYISRSAFMEAPSTETIRRCRQKIQELHSELQSSKWIKKQRDAIAEQKGTHIYREPVSQVWSNYTVRAETPKGLYRTLPVELKEQMKLI